MRSGALQGSVHSVRLDRCGAATTCRPAAAAAAAAAYIDRKMMLYRLVILSALTVSDIVY